MAFVIARATLWSRLLSSSALPWRRSLLLPVAAPAVCFALPVVCRALYLTRQAILLIFLFIVMAYLHLW